MHITIANVTHTIYYIINKAKVFCWVLKFSDFFSSFLNSSVVAKKNYSNVF